MDSKIDRVNGLTTCRMEVRAHSAVEMVARIVAGDVTAEVDMVKEFEHGIRFVLRMKLNNAADVDEITNTVWVTAIPKLRADELKEPCKLPGFLNGIARGLAANYNKRHFHREEVLDCDSVSRARSKEQGVEEQLLEDEMTHLAICAIDQQNHRDREILMAVLLGEDKSKTCDRMGLSVTQFNKVYSRAKKRASLSMEKTPENFDRANGELGR